VIKHSCTLSGVLLVPADPDKRTDEIGNTNKQRLFTPADFNRLTANRLMAGLSLQRGSGGSVCGGELPLDRTFVGYAQTGSQCSKALQFKVPYTACKYSVCGDELHLDLELSVAGQQHRAVAALCRLMASLSLQRGSGGSVCGGELQLDLAAISVICQNTQCNDMCLS
jgi:hypothetical protein